MNIQAARRGAASGGHDDGYGDYAYEDYQLRSGEHYGDQQAQHDADAGYYEQEYDARAYAPNPDEPYGYDDDGNPLFYEHQPATVKTGGRNGAMLIAAVLGLAVLGGGGAVGYKMLSSRGLAGGEPPLIKADTEPVKTVPDNKDSGKPAKAIYDRVDAPPAKSKVVSREEEPVDLPSSPTTEPRPDGSRTIVPGGAQAAGGGEEPRRVKTTTIRADPALIAAAQPVTGTAPSVATPAATPEAPDPIAETARTGEAPKASEFDNGIMSDATTPPKAPAKPAATTPKPADTHVANAPQLASTPKPAPQPSATPRPSPVAPQSTATTPAARSAAPAPQAQQQVAAVAPRAPVAAPSASRGGGYVVQVTSQRSEQDARAAYANLQKKFPQVLGSYQASIQTAEVGDRGTYYRVRVGPFGNNADAATVCTNLRAAGGDCVVSRN